MSTVNSFRFSDECLSELEFLSDELQMSVKDVIEEAVSRLACDQEVTRQLTLDFHDTVGGINSPDVTHFLQHLPLIGYEISMYGNGDRVHLLKVD